MLSSGTLNQNLNVQSILNRVAYENLIDNFYYAKFKDVVYGSEVCIQDLPIILGSDTHKSFWEKDYGDVFSVKEGNFSRIIQTNPKKFQFQ